MFYNMDHNEKTPKSILISDDDAEKTPESYCYGKDVIKDWNLKIHQANSVIHDYDRQKTPKMSDYVSNDYNNMINNKRNSKNHPVEMREQMFPLSNDPIYKFLLNQNMENKPKFLHVSTPKFSGNSKDDIEDCLFMIKQGFIAAKIPDEDRLNAVVNFVAELPLLIFKINIESKSKWFEFEKELKDTFRNVDREHKIRSELSNLKHKESNVEHFVNRFLTLTNKLGFMAEEEKNFYFREGLKENTKREIICRKIVKLSEAIPLAF